MNYVNDGYCNLMRNFTVVIECQKGSNLKIEFDENSGEFKTDFIFKDIAFPYYYGFIPGTKAGDGDTMDAIILSDMVLKTGDAVACKAVGIVKIIDRGEEDDKIIAVPLQDPQAEKLNDLSDVLITWREKWKDFLSEVARQKNKKMEVVGFESREAAEAAIEKSNLLPIDKK